jgi:hypothetical protein
MRGDQKGSLKRNEDRGLSLTFGPLSFFPKSMVHEYTSALEIGSLCATSVKYSNIWHRELDDRRRIGGVDAIDAR